MTTCVTTSEVSAPERPQVKEISAWMRPDRKSSPGFNASKTNGTHHPETIIALAVYLLATGAVSIEGVWPNAVDARVADGNDSWPVRFRRSGGWQCLCCMGSTCPHAVAVALVVDPVAYRR